MDSKGLDVDFKRDEVDASLCFSSGAAQRLRQRDDLRRSKEKSRNRLLPLGPFGCPGLVQSAGSMLPGMITWRNPRGSELMDNPKWRQGSNRTIDYRCPIACSTKSEKILRFSLTARRSSDSDWLQSR
jgi:hypothetical protein